jgi:transposase
LWKEIKQMSKRKFNREFKESAVKLVQEQGYTIPEAARSLGIDPATLRNWVKRAPASASGSTAGDSSLRGELQRLREENQRLLMEREILKKATVFFAKHQS